MVSKGMGEVRPSRELDLSELGNYPGRRPDFTNLDTDSLKKEALLNLFAAPRQGNLVPKHRITKVSLEILTHFGYVKNWPNLPSVVITDKARKEKEELCIPKNC